MDGELSRLRVWFSRRSVDIGRPPKALVAWCAEELAAVFEEDGIKPKWPEVGEVVFRAFPGEAPKALRDSFEEYKYVDKGDAGEWIQGLVKKYRRNDREVKKHEEELLRRLNKASRY
ncbi:MAG: hypothetical protein ACREQ7_09365 [Candidatus Binatia bacterium]